MKIIHTGDIHIGSAMRNLPPEKAQLRNTEILETFRKLTVFARENGVDSVIIAGDLFDTQNISRQIKQEVFYAISAAKPVRFFYVSGNHDADVTTENLPDNFFTFSRDHGWQGYDLGEGVTLTGADSKYLQNAFGTGLRLPKETFNIVTLHGDVTATAQNTADSIPLRALYGSGVDYLALGHIHMPTLQAEKFDGRGYYRYCGCLEGRGFDEVGPRGFFLLEIENKKLKNQRFLSLSKRMVVEQKADISACENYYDVERTVFAALQNVQTEHIIKLILCGQHKVGLQKNIELLTARLKERFFFAKVKDESRIIFRFEEYQNDYSPIGEFVREVGRYEMNNETRGEILDIGFKALAGEEIDL